MLHWGPDLGDLDGDALQATVRALGMPYVDSVVMSQDAVAVLPQHSAGWTGRPGLLGSRAGRGVVGGLRRRHPRPGGGRRRDGPAPQRGHRRPRETWWSPPSSRCWRAVSCGCVPASGTPRRTTYEVAHLEPALPVPAEAAELLDMAGRHTHERTPQRRPFDQGQWVREAWGGRPGHDAATVMCAGASRLRLPRRPGLGRAPGLERQPGAERRALLHRLAAAARRRAAAARRGPAGARRGVHLALAGRLLGGRARCLLGAVPPAPAVPAGAPRTARARCC